MTKLKPRQQLFIDALATAGCVSPLTFADMQAVCDNTGIYKMPPSWITHDSDRKVARGSYAIPELDGVARPTCRQAPGRVDQEGG